LQVINGAQTVKAIVHSAQDIKTLQEKFVG